MTVQELIQELSKFDPETPVIGMCTDPTDYTYKVPIESVEFDNPYDSNGFSGINSQEDDDRDYFDDDHNYIGPKVVIINLGDV
jgi:hypothetical protein